jgi:P4 family phage/plasmid primase-like protien
MNTFDLHYPPPRSCNEAAHRVFPDAHLLGDAFVELHASSIRGDRQIEIRDLNDDFWVGSLEHTLFVTQENQFRQYQAEKGIYAPVTESELIGQLMTRLGHCSHTFPKLFALQSFLELKTRQRLRTVVERARELLRVDEGEAFRPNSPYLIPLRNGVINPTTKQLVPLAPEHRLHSSLPVKFDAAAVCEVFLEQFLAQVVEADDIDLLQRFFSQLLNGVNDSQSILLLTGDAGWGKSSLMKILAALVGWDRVGIIRNQIYSDPAELGHYAGKHLLYAPDMPTDFLNHKEASVFKQLVGGDPMWVETKQDGRRVMEGKFPVVLACNGRPQIKLDQDADAWARRLVVVRFKKPANYDTHTGRLAEVICKTELSGILNWLLAGYAKLHGAGLQLGRTHDQNERTINLLLGSESPQAFVRVCLVKAKDSSVSVAEMYAMYQDWCKSRSLAPSESKVFSRAAKLEIETALGLHYRHDLKTEAGCSRGWKGLRLVDSQNLRNGSVVSADGSPVATPPPRQGDKF